MKIMGVFIDADNVSASQATTAMQMLSENGEIRFAKAYGNFASKTSAWKGFVNQYGIDATHLYNITRSKNAADISLTVDATASLYTHVEYDTMVVVSSDSDFLPLVSHANTLGKCTAGMGTQKAPKTYTNLCKTFMYLDGVGESEILHL